MNALKSGAARKPGKFPIAVRQGSAEVKIYATPVTVGGKHYPQFTVSFYLGAKRIRQRFSGSWPLSVARI